MTATTSVNPTENDATKFQGNGSAPRTHRAPKALTMPPTAVAACCHEK